MLKVSVVLTALALALDAGASAIPLTSRAVTCVSGAYIISARGTDEPKGEGVQAQISSAIKAAVPGSTSVGVDYPAKVFDGIIYVYPQSMSAGIDDLKNKIQTYVDTCGPSSKIILLGYSQGGNVVTDSLAGGLYRPTPLADKYKQAIKGVAVFGDPTFTVNQPIDVGTSKQNGLFVRFGSSLTLLESYPIKSYCDAGDPFCATGTDGSVHVAVVNKYASQAASFLIPKVK